LIAIVRAVIFDPKVLRDAHLIGADLRQADLRDADLRGANLEGADLSGARLSALICAVPTSRMPSSQVLTFGRQTYVMLWSLMHLRRMCRSKVYVLQGLT
jgi:hypothetical protein